jgi:hypothetical protein
MTSAASTPGPMSQRPAIVLSAVLRLLRPVVRLLIRQGVGLPAVAAALKPVFLDEARQELERRGMGVTDSALTLLSGVHRRDVRRLLREATEVPDASPNDTSAWGPVSELVGRWLTDPVWVDADGRPRTLSRTGDASFEMLAASVSSDVRPRAMLDELLRLGVAEADDRQVRLHADGFAPRQGFQELSELFAANLHDHLAAAAANLQGEANFLEQAVFVDELTEASVQSLQQVARDAWQQALRRVMAEARKRYDQDAAGASAAERVHRARFGVYFFKAQEPLP